MAYYRCGPTAIGSRTSWGPVTSPADASYQRPLSGNYDRIFNAFERTNAFQYVRKDKEEDRQTGHGDVVVNRKSSSLERADCALAAQTPCDDDEEFYREKVLYSQARQLYPLQEDLADWINKTVGIDYITGENFLDVLDNGAELCQLAAVIHDRAREALHQGLLVGPVPQIRGRCWQRAARRSFFSRDNTENFITFCRDLGVHENLLFESDDLVLHNQPRQVILCLLEVARLATRFGLEPPGLVQLEKEIALEERDSGLDSAMSSAPWQFRDLSPVPDKPNTDAITLTPEPNDENQLSVVDDVDADARSEGTVASSDSDVPLKPTNELDKRVQLVTRLMERGCRCGSGRCDKLLKVKKVGEGRYNIAGRNVFIRLLKGRHMMVRVGGGWDTLEHFLSRHEPCQVRLVTQGRRPAPLPVPAPDPSRSARATPDPTDKPTELSTPNLKSPSSSSRSSLDGKTSPNSRSRQSLDGKTSPSRSRSSLDGKSSPEIRNPISSSTPKRKPQLTLPLKTTTEKIPVRTRKQSAPSFSTPTTPSHTAPAPPAARRTPSLTPKKSRSMSLALVKDDGKKPFCGTDRLNQGAKKTRPASVAIAPVARKTRSQSLASTPVNEPKKTFTNGFARKTRSMSLANPVEPVKLLNKSQSVTSQGGLTQAAIEESIRRSLAATLTEDCPTKPFLHIKAKYRSPPPREVPPR